MPKNAAAASYELCRRLYTLVGHTVRKTADNCKLIIWLQDNPLVAQPADVSRDSGYHVPVVVGSFAMRNVGEHCLCL